MIKPMVSIIITTYKGNENLIRAIYSSINQTYDNIEVIVVDDNNTDSIERNNTEKMMEQFSKDSRIKYIKHEINKNGAAARNTGIACANGEYLSFLDDDDIYLPDKIEKSVNYLNNNQDKQGVYSSVLFMNSKSFYSIRKSYNSNNYQRDLLIDNNLLGTGSNIFIKKECIKKLKGFDTSFLRFQDVEFMIRFLDYYNLGAIEEVLVVKDSGDLVRRPDYTKVKSMVDLFINKFELTISKLDINDNNLFFSNIYRMLYYVAINSNNKNNIINAKKELLKFSKLSIKDKLYSYDIIRNIISKIKKTNALEKNKKLISDANYAYLKEINS